MPPVVEMADPIGERHGGGTSPQLYWQAAAIAMVRATRPGLPPPPVLLGPPLDNPALLLFHLFRRDSRNTPRHPGDRGDLRQTRFMTRPRVSLSKRHLVRDCATMGARLLVVLFALAALTSAAPPQSPEVRYEVYAIR